MPLCCWRRWLFARREGVFSTFVPAGLVALVLGAETYVVNVVRHGNPIWPVRVDFGPVHLPGLHVTTELLSSGANTPRTQGNLVLRVFSSWTTVFPPVPVFDMRVGGLGLLFLIALPVAVVHTVRARSPAVALVAVAMLAVPDPSLTRFVLGFAGLAIAIAVPCVDRIRNPARWLVFGVVALAAVQSIVVAYRLTGEGPPLQDYVHMNLAERQRAVGADGPPWPYLDTINKVRPGEITAFDQTAELPYYAWPFDLSRDAQRIADDATRRKLVAS